MRISEFLRPENVILDLAAPSKERLLQALAERAAKSLGGNAAQIFTALANREQLGSTGMGQGIAIPHATLDGIARPFGLLAKLSKPVDFEAIDEAPVDIVFLLLNPTGGSSLALKALACMARVLRSEGVLNYIRSSEDPAQVYDRVSAEFTP